jgi:hypothetical protein
MENGAPTSSINAWLNACWALDRLGDLDGVLAARASLFDQPKPRLRVRAPRARPVRKIARQRTP